MNDFLEESLDKIAYIPGIIFAFFLIFIVHELGHYWAARLRNMKIETFSVGVGKRFYSIHDRHGTEWVFRYFPLGGHVQITDLTLDEGTKSRRSVGTRLFVVLAGPLANLILPFIILPLCFILIGFPATPPVLSSTTIGSNAEKAGLQRGDLITAINDKKIYSYEQVSDIIENSNGNILNFEVNRNDTSLTIPVKPKHDVYTDIVGISRDTYRVGIITANLPIPLDFIHGVGNVRTKDNEELARKKLIEAFDQDIIIGLYNIDDNVYSYPVVISSKLNQHLLDEDHRLYNRVYLGPLDDNTFITLSPIESLKYGFYQAASLVQHVVKVPFQIFPIDPKLFAERISFLSDSEFYYQNLIYRAAFQTALLSILIGFINLIPFPRLDGDFVLTYMMEKFLGKKPTSKQRAYAIAACLFLIYCTVLISNLEDIPGYIERKLEEYSGDGPLQACKLPD